MKKLAYEIEECRDCEHSSNGICSDHCMHDDLEHGYCLSCDSEVSPIDIRDEYGEDCFE